MLKRKFAEFIKFIGTKEVIYMVKQDRKDVVKFVRYCAKLNGTRLENKSVISKKQYDKIKQEQAQRDKILEIKSNQ